MRIFTSKNLFIFLNNVLLQFAIKSKYEIYCLRKNFKKSCLLLYFVHNKNKFTKTRRYKFVVHTLLITFIKMTASYFKYFNTKTPNHCYVR